MNSRRMQQLSFLLQVKRDCAGEFEKAGILIPDCSWIYPDESHPTGLCKVDKFPAPWPAKGIAAKGKIPQQFRTGKKIQTASLA